MIEEVYLSNRINQILIDSVNGNLNSLKSVIKKARAGLGPDQEKKMAELILIRLYCIPKADIEIKLRGTNTVLLESLIHLNTDELDMSKLLLGYSSRIHKIPCIKNKEGELTAPWAKQHLLDVGLTINECGRRNFRPKKISPIHWRSSL